MEMQQMMEFVLAKMDGRHEKMARLKARMYAVHGKMIASQERTIAKMDAWPAEMKDGRKEKIACQETTEARLECKEPTSVDMKSEAEHREIPTEHTAVESGKAPKKMYWDWHLAAGRPGKPKERTRGNCGSRRKFAASRRRMTCRAGVAWRERNVVRKNRIRDKVERGTRRVRALRKR
jgi:hypothetical protein